MRPDICWATSPAMISSSLTARISSGALAGAPATGVDGTRMLIGTAPLERSHSACYPQGLDLSLRLRAPTMTPAIVEFNSRRKYQVHPRTTAGGPGAHR